jgi:hypothetical protein
MAGLAPGHFLFLFHFPHAVRREAVRRRSGIVTDSALTGKSL